MEAVQVDYNLPLAKLVANIMFPTTEHLRQVVDDHFPDQEDRLLDAVIANTCQADFYIAFREAEEHNCGHTPFYKHHMLTLIQCRDKKYTLPWMVIKMNNGQPIVERKEIKLGLCTGCYLALPINQYCPTCNFDYEYETDPERKREARAWLKYGRPVYFDWSHDTEAMIMRDQKPGNPIWIAYFLMNHFERMSFDANWYESETLPLRPNCQPVVATLPELIEGMCDRNTTDIFIRRLSLDIAEATDAHPRAVFNALHHCKQANRWFSPYEVEILEKSEQVYLGVRQPSDRIVTMEQYITTRYYPFYSPPICMLALEDDDEYEEDQVF